MRIAQRGLCRACGESDPAAAPPPEHFGEPAVPDAALKLHLPQAILGVRVAEPVEGVEPRGGEHVR